MKAILDPITEDRIKGLLTRRPPCVSIYIQTPRAGKEVRHNAVRLRNALHEAETMLAPECRKHGVPSEQCASAIEPGFALCADRNYWAETGPSLGVFCSPGFFWTCRLGKQVPESVVVGDHFCVKPLLFALQDIFICSVLSVGGRRVRLLKVTPFGVAAVTRPDLATSIKEAMRFLEAEPQLQFHTQTQRYPGRRPAAFFGHSGGADRSEKKLRIREFFESARPAIEDYLKERVNGPLVLAAADYIHPIFREVMGGLEILPEGLIGNVESWEDEEVAARAREMVIKFYEERRLSEYQRALDLAGGSAYVSLDINETLPAAHRGLVEKVITPIQATLWGRFDEEGQYVEVHRERRPGDEDLVDRVAQEVLGHKGRVEVLGPAPEKDFPSSPVAILRAPRQVTGRAAAG